MSATTALWNAMIDLDPKDWIQICRVEKNQLCFTEEYLSLTRDLGSCARKLAAHLVTHWSKDYEKILDYFGPENAEEDWYSGIDGEPMDVCESMGEQLEFDKAALNGLTNEWYRNVVRAKLTTLKLPKQLIEEYVNIAKR